jgi:hypothetical protein
LGGGFAAHRRAECSWFCIQGEHVSPVRRGEAFGSGTGE